MSSAGEEVKKRGRPKLVDQTCASCHTTTTTQWRKGANGARLCNKCGLKHHKEKSRKDSEKKEAEASVALQGLSKRIDGANDDVVVNLMERIRLLEQQISYFVETIDRQRFEIEKLRMLRQLEVQLRGGDLHGDPYVGK